MTLLFKQASQAKISISKTRINGKKEDELLQEQPPKSHFTSQEPCELKIKSTYSRFQSKVRTINAIP